MMDGLGTWPSSGTYLPPLVIPDSRLTSLFCHVILTMVGLHLRVLLIVVTLLFFLYYRGSVFIFRIMFYDRGFQSFCTSR